MDQDLFEKFLVLMSSENDSDAVMGLRGVKNLFHSEGLSFEEGMRYAVQHIEEWKPTRGIIEHEASPVAPVAAAPSVPPTPPIPPTPSVATGPAVVNNSNVPECRITGPGVVEFVLPGESNGQSYQIPGEAAQHIDLIVEHLKDALVAAVLNKSKFKIKLSDVKNDKGEIVETILRAEYAREGMVPVQIWVFENRGEVGALASVLRQALSNSLQDLAA